MERRLAEERNEQRIEMERRIAAGRSDSAQQFAKVWWSCGENGWMDGWISFRPVALSLEGLGTLNTYNADRFSHDLEQV